jgi:hypothetical protein
LAGVLLSGVSEESKREAVKLTRISTVFYTWLLRKLLLTPYSQNSRNLVLSFFPLSCEENSIRSAARFLSRRQRGWSIEIGAWGSQLSRSKYSSQYVVKWNLYFLDIYHHSRSKYSGQYVVKWNLHFLDTLIIKGGGASIHANMW